VALQSLDLLLCHVQPATQHWQQQQQEEEQDLRKKLSQAASSSEHSWVAPLLLEGVLVLQPAARTVSWP
jgi:hypothetical protein